MSGDEQVQPGQIPRVALGKTGISVSRLGLGCGGPSRLGMSQDVPAEDSIRIIQYGIRHGINFIDTAEAYRTESLVGTAIRAFDRSDLVISTKLSIRTDAGDLISVDEARRHLEQSLERLGTDYVDIYHLHGVRPEQYAEARDRFLPLFDRLRVEGLIRHPGVTELFNGDHRHEMLQQAIADDVWDVVMVGYNLLNQSAERLVFPLSHHHTIGTLVMFAVRRALSRPERFREVMSELNLTQGDDESGGWGSLQFLLEESHARTIPDAAYRYCLAEPRADVILSGTGSLSHLKQNIESIHRGALAEPVVARIRALFGSVDSVTGE